MLTTDANQLFHEAVGSSPAEGLRDELRALEEQAREDFSRALDEAVKAHFPRRRKATPKDLPDQVVEAVRAGVMARHPRIPELEAAVEKAEEEHDQWVREVAREYRFTPDPARPLSPVRVAAESRYRSQTQPGLYAEGELLPLRRALEARGYAVEVAREPGRWVLNSNASVVDVMALEMVMTQEERWGVYRRTVVNPRVYNPWLPWDAWP